MALVLIASGAFGFRFWGESRLAAREPLTDLAPHPLDPGKIFLSSEREVYLQTDGEGRKRLLSLTTEKAVIRKIITHPRLPEKIFLLTDEGILEGDLKKSRVKSIYRSPNHSENRVYSLALDPEDPKLLYLGTERGLLQSADGGRTWLPPYRWPENQRIEFVATIPSMPEALFLGAERELFFSNDRGLRFESGLSLPFSNHELEENSEEAEEAIVKTPRFTSLAFSQRTPAQLWMGTAEGVFETSNAGLTWEKLPEQGLGNHRIRDLLYAERSAKLIAATDRDVAVYFPRQRRWETLPVGLTEPPTSLGLQPTPDNKTDKVLIASGHQILEWVLDPVEGDSGQPFVPSSERLELFQKLTRSEPTAQEIHQAAIRYSHLGNGRIQRWHWGSRLRALVPSLSFGKDVSLNANIDLDRGGTSDPDKFIFGPDETDRGWDLDLNWNLGDLIWSSSQTSIDSRAKLLVELRESILSQVNRIYFERRRTQMELAFSAPEVTPREHFDLLLRLDELTAELDTLTDGFLSERLLEIYRRHPELNEIYN